MPRRKLKLRPRFVLLFACLAASISIYSLPAVERGIASAQSASSSQAPNMKEVYERAEKFLPAQVSRLVRNLTIEPIWIDGTDCFTYRRQLPNQGKEFVLVDPERNTVQPAFDHARLAAALASQPGGKAYTATTLPFERLTLSEKNGSLEFNLGGKPWRCSLADYKLGPGVEKDPSELPSPDGKWMAFVRDHNLWVRSTADGRERALTTDGEEAYSYATAFTGIDLISVRRFNRKIQAQAAWSPDSTRLFTHRIDLRNVGKQHLLQSIPDTGDKVGEARRPIIHSWSYAMPGDGAVPMLELMVIDVVTGRRIDLRTPRLPQIRPVMQVPQLGGLFAGRNAFWHPDGTMVYVVEITRNQKTRRLWAANPSTGEPRLLVEEHSKTWVEGFEARVPPRILAARKQILWWSDLSGWGHLYLHDLESGKLVRQVTSGDWLVREILASDDKRVYIAGGGRESDREPYFRHIYSVDLDTEAITLLTPEDADHEAAAADQFAFERFSPSGRYFIDTQSRVDQPSVSVLRDCDGKIIRELERADISEYLKIGYRPPRRFSVKASDGKTDIYGVLMYPTNFDPARKYPVIDAIYGGPQSIKAPKRFQAGAVEQAIAELGFIVYQIDGLGTPWRSRAYQNFSYANLGASGDLKSHVEGLRQLAREHPYLDLDRVGIFGHSGGGTASARAMLLFPDFYKVAVSSAGNHDQLGYLYGWGERYQGQVNGANYDQADNAKLAANLKGKLLLAYGDMDDNVSPSLTIRLIDALIKANKDYDLLVMPNRNHAFGRDPYFHRRRWDYLVKHLLGAEPPVGYQIKAVIPEPQR